MKNLKTSVLIAGALCIFPFLSSSIASSSALPTNTIITAQNNVKQYLESGDFSFNYPSTWKIQSEEKYPSGAMSITVGRGGNSPNSSLLGQVYIVVSISSSIDSLYRTSEGRSSSFEERKDYFLNSPFINTNVKNRVSKQGVISGRKYISIYGDERTLFGNFKHFKFLIEYNDKLDMHVEAAIVDKETFGNGTVTVVLPKDNYSKTVDEISSVLSSLQILR